MTNTIGEFLEALEISEENKDLLIQRNPPLTPEQMDQTRKESAEAQIEAQKAAGEA